MAGRLMQWKRAVSAGVASLIQRFEARLLLVIGTACTAMALGMFALEHLSARGAESRSDAILKLRLSSPRPAPNVVIVDIDERSLALLAPKHGPWPWSRELPAEGLQKIIDAGAKGVLFGLMMSDPDRRYPDGDVIMEMTASGANNAAFPMIRLNPANDTQSQLRVASLPGARLADGVSPDRTLAVIIPSFASMQQRMGVADQRPDDDGLVRSYPLRWDEEEFTLPSIVQRTLESAGVNTDTLPDTMTLNWRNKRGKYQRLSFADLLTLPPDSPKIARLRNAFVVVGVSAPGIGQNKATAIKPVVDDNEILATALDDALNHTYLRTPPDWLLLTLTIAGIWGLVALAIRRTPATTINKLFLYAQGLLLAVMLIGASYANYLIDLSGMMSFLLLVFAGIKLVCTIGHASASAAPGYRQSAIPVGARHILLVGMRTDRATDISAAALERQLFAVAGLRNVIRIDDLFGGHNFLAQLLSNYLAFIVLADDTSLEKIEASLTSYPASALKICHGELPAGTDIEGEAFKARVTGLLTQNAATLFAA